MSEKAGITKAKLKEAIEYVFKQNPKPNPDERRIRLIRGCSTFGKIEGVGKNCGSKECHSCVSMAEVCNREVKKMLKDVNNLDNSDV